jgi:hypothetical protein
MSDLQAASEAIAARLEAIDPSMSEDVDPWALMFVGFDVNSDDAWHLAGDYADAALVELGEAITRSVSRMERHALAHGYFRSAWLDGFSVAAMLYLKRSEDSTR